MGYPYVVEIKETACKHVVVYAESKEDAEGKAEELYVRGEINLDKDGLYMNEIKAMYKAIDADEKVFPVYG